MAYVRTDVTAVKFHEDFIFAGIGSYTNIFSKHSLKPLQRLHTLEGQKIYGFVPSKCGEKVLCFGGKQYTVLGVSGVNSDICTRLFAPVVSDDWIHSGVWVDGETVALLTAHNTVQFWDISTQTLLSQNGSKDNSILYSGLLLPLEDDVLVLAGTVFSEVIIHCCKESQPLQHLRGHRGVIFSICCDTQKEFIVTTSDDRSLRIWSPNQGSKHKINTKVYWQQIDMACKHELYGHSARVMRSCISVDTVVSVGEDGAICFWNLNGELLRKKSAHQNSCIWAVDADNGSIVTGGGDCGIMVHPMAEDCNKNDILERNAEVKKVVFTARRNIVMMTDDHIIYYNVDQKDRLIYEFNHTSTYKLLCISSCRQIIAIADMDGNLDIFIENCKEDCLQNVMKTKLELGKILSMHWGDNRHLVLCTQNGTINIIAKGNNVENICRFVLPACKERWLTAAAFVAKKNVAILGDRCGNIHVFSKGQNNPIKTFRKVHGRYGPTSITVKDNKIVSTGRDGTIRFFAITNDKVKYMSSKSLEFQWVEKFLDKDENVICGFQERDFVVYDIRDSNKTIEVPCGGGHRSWDAIRFIDKIKDQYEEFIKLIYIKNSDINIATFELSKIVSRTVINGSHSKEINCLQCCTSTLDTTKTFYISGGEDTTLRVSNFDPKMDFVDRIVYKHLSNIRTLKIYKFKDENVLLISAGGRAQICVNLLNFEKKQEDIKLIFEEVLDYQIKGTDKEKKGYQNWRNCTIDFDPETRVMDIEAKESDDANFIVYLGCSDAYLRIYNLKHTENPEFKLIKEIKHKTCILKTHCIKYENEHILVTCTTRGVVSFWDTNNIATADRPFFTTTTNKSGINSITSKPLSNGDILIATGGDDNAIHLVLINVQPNLISATLKSSLILDSLHSSQITGLCFFEEYLLSASIDQRVSLLRWRLFDEGIVCDFVSQIFCDVADIQGMDLIDSESEIIRVVVFGKGMAIVELNKPS